MDSIIFHIDVNSAFLSWTAIDQLQKARKENCLDSYVDLRTIPSIVGGDSASRHGIVLAKSVPAKKYGIVTGEPIAQALKKCPFLTIAPSNHSSYSAHSKRFRKYLADFCPIIEAASIDECYMDYTPISKDYASPEEAARIIKDGVRDTFGFTVNIGISDKKVLAKMASDFKKPDLVHTLYTHEIREKMWPLPVSSLLMCGNSSQEALRKLGIRTIGELACTDPKLLSAHLKSHGILLWQYANGIDDSRVEPVPDQAKGIGNSTTMSKDAYTIDEMKPVILSLCESVSARLRHQHFLAGTVTVEIKYNTFQSVSHQTALQTPANTSNTLYHTSLSLLEELWNGTPVRLLGVRATKLVDESEPLQMNLFTYTESQQTTPLSEKNKKLDKTIDAIRQKYGNNAIMRGSLLSSPSTKKAPPDDDAL
ncbi:MAG: DNA polymerase IV [Lachnospiraceae bacterium]|nr:DNA polymerase IV [Lachnospiraceae bacterium]